MVGTVLWKAWVAYVYQVPTAEYAVSTGAVPRHLESELLFGIVKGVFASALSVGLALVPLCLVVVVPVALWLEKREIVHSLTSRIAFAISILLLAILMALVVSNHMVSSYLAFSLPVFFSAVFVQIWLQKSA